MEVAPPLEALGKIASERTGHDLSPEIQHLLADKIQEGYEILSVSCPTCCSPLVKQPVTLQAVEQAPSKEGPLGASCSWTSDAEGSVVTPMNGVPFCVQCTAHVVTSPDEMAFLAEARMGRSGSILIAMNSEAEDNEDDQESNEIMQQIVETDEGNQGNYEHTQQFVDVDDEVEMGVEHLIPDALLYNSGYMDADVEVAEGEVDVGVEEEVGAEEEADEVLEEVIETAEQRRELLREAGVISFRHVQTEDTYESVSDGVYMTATTASILAQTELPTFELPEDEMPEDKVPEDELPQAEPPHAELPLSETTEEIPFFNGHSEQARSIETDPVPAYAEEKPADEDSDDASEAQLLEDILDDFYA
eukprot:13797437-Ditylum_brightwellii.AAC.1